MGNTEIVVVTLVLLALLLLLVVVLVARLLVDAGAGVSATTPLFGRRAILMTTVDVIIRPRAPDD